MGRFWVHGLICVGGFLLLEVSFFFFFFFFFFFGDESMSLFNYVVVFLFHRVTR